MYALYCMDSKAPLISAGADLPMVRCRWGAAGERSLQAKFRSLEVAARLTR